MAYTSASDGAWIRRFHSAAPGTGDRVRLVCLPHAGGSASSYFPLSAALAADTETLAVQYPGRQDRHSEAPIGSITELADEVYGALEPWTGRPVALFGHSMGALVAFEVARRMEDRAGVTPGALFVSGRRAPSRHRPETVHLKDDAGLLAELRSLSGTDSRLLGDEELLAMIMPAIRADYAALAAYRFPAAARPLRCPVTALVGDADPVTTIDDARAWDEHTGGDFELRIFPGGHFYLNGHEEEIAALISRQVKNLM
ncbi:thioesterase II family protein [Streptomyces sp. 7N604]|uniref:thioesterase II family protein n=1 Tax=Streptomyces sp. 7N604 TaxID=3457415 RepID=UPI003FD48FA7